MAKILIIDDDSDIVEAMRVVLENKGYGVVSAENGKDGLIKASLEKPELIILDVMMPGIDGFEVARELKKNVVVKNIPILMLTAVKKKTGFDFKAEAGDPDWLPVDDYCDKPLDYEVLLERVAVLISRSKL
ncbi:MAG: hypothetical protein A3G33_05880 [Omnitrophica bacterium RIFCSPLOWO2_12_FULL_44_17]|uniref:Response regulatory domain-containing protein n=1 Tax=Candidatus Danuiimicrobium aquiferis TaxID=1801832 RepID=A0A1G1L366_9BACT|nr:MAG: hypothetical protein A3B72_06110 [Omnitrophica bacterium RIFCSPHIGHO2_02_FULL_45_28]OGW99319.1 MAG: hypothetical protein A3G33_05880 [Omnitrophica bacterium RIFCSPLOWO2_12_FULL_44_17]OGX02480.1 MAG: hypothetical protein A3J12_09330 [Omnitrophica bacterium RIFCSPLOWO2_02_FULL_44_11]